MSYTVPYSFTPGTKARAQEVNANFNTLTDYFSTLDSAKADINLSNISADGINVIKNNATIRNIGEMIISPLPLTDSGLHLLDGTLINNEGIYKDFIKYIKQLYNNDSSANFFTTESLWQNAVSTYGVCGKFVYNSTNNTVRLPKLTGIIEGTTNVSYLGNITQAGLPNITGTITSGAYFDTGETTMSGAFSKYNGTCSTRREAYAQYPQSGIVFNAHKSNPMYGNSLTVQPQTVKCFYYIVIATTAKTDIQIDIDEIATDLNGKADTDLTNISPSLSFKTEVTEWGSPDYSNRITVSSNPSTAGTYKAPSNGLMIFDFTLYGGTGYVTVNGNDITRRTNTNTYMTDYMYSLPVNKNDIVGWYTSHATSGYGTRTIKFVPLKGVS